MQIPAVSLTNYNDNHNKVNFAGRGGKIQNFCGGSDAAIDLVYGEMGERAYRIGTKLKQELNRQTAEVAKEYKEIGYLLPGNPLENRENMVKYMFRCIAEGFFDCNINFK